jgi:hypothetical protein
MAGDTNLVQFQADGRYQTGLSLARNHETWCILGNDGQLHFFETVDQFKTVSTIDGEFKAATPVELRGILTREFGPAFEVVTTKHFLVVQPKGRGTKWPDTFEQLHVQFTRQLKMLGVHVRTGKFMMVAVVLPDRSALQTELTRRKIDNKSIAGVYIANCNRVYTYDSGSSTSTIAVLRHEAAHQSAFNSNIHSRLNDTPKWISEGLGMLFEAPGMASGRSPHVRERVNADSASQTLVRYSDPQQSLANDIRRLIIDDTLFMNEKEVSNAYNVSWLMMFYLSERRPSAFAQFINHTASRPPFVDYEQADKLKDFQRITGLSIDQFAAESAKYLQSVAR